MQADIPIHLIQTASTMKESYSMKLTKQRLKEIIKEELGFGEGTPAADEWSKKKEYVVEEEMDLPRWSALDQAFAGYLAEYKEAARHAQGEEELNDLWDHTTAQLRALTNEESFHAHGRMSAGSTASRKPRQLE